MNISQYKFHSLEYCCCCCCCRCLSYCCCLCLSVQVRLYWNETLMHSLLKQFSLFSFHRTGRLRSSFFSFSLFVVFWVISSPSKCLFGIVSDVAMGTISFSLASKAGISPTGFFIAIWRPFVLEILPSCCLSLKHLVHVLLFLSLLAYHSATTFFLPFFSPFKKTFIIYLIFCSMFFTTHFHLLIFSGAAINSLIFIHLRLQLPPMM